jgi:septal ring factor EnvC (AmiA/AmiB activator)
VCRREGVAKDVKELDTSVTRQRADMARLNAMLADKKAAKASLENDVSTLQGKTEQATKV